MDLEVIEYYTIRNAKINKIIYIFKLENQATAIHFEYATKSYIISLCSIFLTHNLKTQV